MLHGKKSFPAKPTAGPGTPLGRGRSGRIAAIRGWAYASIDGIEAARRDFDQAAGEHA
jgi:hypothetical protein